MEENKWNRLNIQYSNLKLNWRNLKVGILKPYLFLNKILKLNFFKIV